MSEIKEFISKERILKKVKKLAAKIKKDYNDEVYCVIVLTGAIVFFTDLMRALKELGMEIQFSHIKLSSYEGTESKGEVEVILNIVEDLTGKDVLVVEDIVDTGITLDFLDDYLKKKGARSIKTVALLNKKSRRKVEVNIDYTGFEIPDKFIVGYGMDLDQKYRDLDYIGIFE